MDCALSDSGLSSPLSSPPASLLSSPLSSPASSPEPENIMARRARSRPERAYPSPTASQETSQTSSPTPDGMATRDNSDGDGPPPAKRRRISRDPKERTTEYLDLRSGVVDPEDQEDLDRVLSVLHKRQKIVVIAGAGMSVSAGIPDFRSENGLFKSLKEEHNLKGKGSDLFNASVYKDEVSTQLFHSMVSSMSRMTKVAKPTAFHQMLATMAKEGRLLRLYTQNVDSLDTSIEPLQTRVPLTKDAEGKWPRTVQLHGGLDKMVCTKCHELSDLNADVFDEAASAPPTCPTCEEVNNIRTNHEGKRSHGVGWLRPRMVLYDEHNPDQDAIGSVMKEDLRRRPDAVIVVGTSMKIPGVQRIVKELCGIVRDRKDGGLAVWINRDLPPSADGLRDRFDVIVQSSCDEVANHAAMRKWNDPVEQDDFSEVSEEDVAKAAAKKAEVHVPKASTKSTCLLTHANLIKLETEDSINNSFKPRLSGPDATPRKKSMDAGPGDWSPLTSKRSSILPSIEYATAESDNITLSGGLLTPSKSQRSASRKSTPVKKLATINEKLKDAKQAQKPAAKKSKSTTATKPAKKSNVKYVKPPLSMSKAKIAAKSKSQPRAKNSSIAGAFTQTKAVSVVAKNAAKKALSSPAKTPSKLRQVSTAAGSSPSKKVVASFPGLQPATTRCAKRKSVSS